MKYFVFFTACCLGIPIGVILCSIKRSFAYFLLVVLLFSLLWPSELSITFENRQHYRMATRGFEIHLADLVAVVLGLFIVFGRREYPVRWVPALTVPLLLFIGMAFVSWLSVVGSSLPVPDAVKVSRQSMMLFDYGVFELGLYPLFEISKLIRGLFLFWVMANLFQDPVARRVLCQTLGFMAVYLFFAALMSRYVYGEYRATSAIGHTNNFNCFLGMVGAFVFPAVLQRKNLLASLWYAFAVIGGFVGIVLTVSRSSLAGYCLAILFGLAMGLRRFASVRNLVLTCIGILCAFLALYKAADTLFLRFFVTEDFESSMDVRIRFIAAAKMMAQDFPFGAGMGNFSAWSWSRYADLVESPPGTLVHNIWFLTLAELGYLGVFFFGLVWARFVQMQLFMVGNRNIWRDGELLIGFIGSVAAVGIVNLQSFYHFSMRQLSVYFLTQVMLGLSAAIYHERRKRQVVPSEEIEASQPESSQELAEAL